MSAGLVMEDRLQLLVSAILREVLAISTYQLNNSVHLVCLKFVNTRFFVL